MKGGVMHWDTVTVAVVRLLGVVAALAAIMTARTAQGATAWAVSLIAYPYVALPLYAVFGIDRFTGYVRARRIHDADLSRELAIAARSLAAQGRSADARLYGQPVFERLAGMRFTHGNAPELLVDGEATFGAIVAAVAAARAYVLVEFYIVRDDGLGRRLVDALAAAVARGVDVYLLYDAIGSHELGAGFRDLLDRAGIRHGAFRSTRSPRSRIQANFRNHRKIVVADGRIAFVGGHNVGDEYLGLDPKIGAWRDTHLRLEGPAACEAQLAFVEDWHWTTGELPRALVWDVAPGPGSASALVLRTGPADPHLTCAAMFTEAIDAARQRLWLATPYFVPDPAMMTALLLARLRGVDVRLIVTGRSDNRLSDLASSTYVPEALRAGVRVYRYLDGFMHQKVFLLDDALAAVMSANFDVRSFRLNFEVAALVRDDGFASQVAAMLERDLARSEEVRLDRYEQAPLGRKLAARTARLLTPVL
jgi:cardiolipin synthase